MTVEWMAPVECHVNKWPRTHTLYTVMVALGATIHEFACHQRVAQRKLVDGRTKSDHDDVGLWRRVNCFA
jgi:hypothetical protein